MNRASCPPMLLAVALVTGLTGCATGPVPRPVAEFVTGPVGPAAYTLGCGDVLEVTFADRPAWDCAAAVGLDGRLPLAPAGQPVVEGLTLPAAHVAIASAAKVEPGAVGLSLVECRAGRLYLTGPENGVRRTLPYTGPESVGAFLDRSGALMPGTAQLQNVRVLRPNVATGGQPQVFHVLSTNPTTELMLQASDEVQVGETFRSRLARVLPDWALPVYRKLVGLLPPDGPVRR